MASNYDITDLYIDGILKVLDHDINRLGVVLDEMAAIAGHKAVQHFAAGDLVLVQIDQTRSRPPKAMLLLWKRA